MEFKKLTREVLCGRNHKSQATIVFTKRGRIILSAVAVKKLGIRLEPKYNEDSFIDIFEGESISDFYISKGNTYHLRNNGEYGGALFNCSVLSDRIRECSWNHTPHLPSEPAPIKCTLFICDKPVDDEENSHIFALLRKKT